MQRKRLLCVAALQPLAAAAPSKLGGHFLRRRGRGHRLAARARYGQRPVDDRLRLAIGQESLGPQCRESFADGQAGEGIPQTLPPGVESVNALFLTHAHADHLGRVPLLVDRGFTGPIYTTEATAALAVPMLRVLLRLDRVDRPRLDLVEGVSARAEDRPQVALRPLAQLQISPGNRPVEPRTGDLLDTRVFDRFARQTPPTKVALCSECVADQVAAVLRHVRPGEIWRSHRRSAGRPRHVSRRRPHPGHCQHSV